MKGLLNFFFFLASHVDGVLVDDVRRKLVGMFIPGIQAQIRSDLTTVEESQSGNLEPSKSLAGIFGGYFFCVTLNSPIFFVYR